LPGVLSGKVLQWRVYRAPTNHVFFPWWVQIFGMIPAPQTPVCTAYRQAHSGGAACYEVPQVGLTVLTFVFLYLFKKIIPWPPASVAKSCQGCQYPCAQIAVANGGRGKDRTEGNQK
jgi:hypothetical protein